MEISYEIIFYKTWTDWNIKGKIQGSCDVELNKTGILQAEELSDKIIKSNYKFSKIYTSKQKRALKTACTQGNSKYK